MSIRNLDLKGEYAPKIVLNYSKSSVKKRNLQEVEERVKFLKEAFDPNTFDLVEELILIAMDSDFDVIGWYPLAKGSENTCLVDFRMIFAVLLRSFATKFIIAHNHPSNEAYPSEADTEISKTLLYRSRELGIDYVDDIILGQNDQYFSLEASGHPLFQYD